MATSSDMFRGRLSALMVDESRHVLPQVLDRIRAEEPDCIVYESMCVWGRIAVEVLNVPAMTLRPTYAMNERVFSMMARSEFRILHPCLK